MRKIVVLNPKGGSGKTTLATNLAGYYAVHERPPALMDLDQQGSSMRWLGKREHDWPVIHGIAGFKVPANVTRSFAMRIPPSVERVIVDTPAGPSSQQMLDFARDADRILIPVLPSDIDIHSATRCVSDLLLHARIPRSANRIAVVANRVKRNTVAFRSLMRFLESLRIPAIAVLRDSQNYVRGVETGRAIHEIAPGQVREDLASWASLLDWVEHGAVPATSALHELKTGRIGSG